MANSVSRLRDYRRLTDQQVCETVALMGMTGQRHDNFLALALSGDTAAHFVVASFRRRVIRDLEEET